ncbi:hypothetical protein FRC02_011760 [Tulasnella sp. 418]|nr:hypothetical protein FRC02_011760 [Tulasnella sp. 418]
MLAISYSPLLLSFLYLSGINAWGPLGHTAVAKIATSFITQYAMQNISLILSQDQDAFTPLKGWLVANPHNMVDVATWADSYKNTPMGSFSSGLHSMGNPNDPPTHCHLDLSKDCHDQRCIVTAIANYTERLLDPSLDVQQHAQALKFLIHLVGDVSQPLHTHGYEKGGNKIKVQWDNHKKRLHTVWDSLILQQIAGGANLAALTKLSTDVEKEIKGGTLQSAVQSWVSCTDPNRILECATEWASDSNALVCSIIMNLPAPTADLSTDYYVAVKDVAVMQVAKASVRLAALLNYIFTGSSGF